MELLEVFACLFVSLFLPRSYYISRFTDADGHIDLILPSCDLQKCEIPAIYAYSKNSVSRYKFSDMF